MRKIGLLKMWKIHQAKQTMKYADDTLLYFARDDVNIVLLSGLVLIT